jgi:hypothetical protein
MKNNRMERVEERLNIDAILAESARVVHRSPRFGAEAVVDASGFPSSQVNREFLTLRGVPPRWANERKKVGTLYS